MSIILVPTSHVAEESIQKIKEVIEKTKPDCVAVELDKNRYLALKSEQVSGKPNLGFTTNVIFTLLKKLQEKIGDIVGIMPGSDMLTAVETAKEKSIPVYFIDQDIQKTLEALKMLKLTEKLKLIKYALTASFYIYTGRGKEKIDLTKVPPEQLIDDALEVFKITFPQLYKILVEDRNQYMAANLKKLSENYNTVVAVVGAGHYKGIKSLLETK
ncbi:MAG TPA: TraB domain-containing protein [archaeon]|nr:TraB domain-containing protein [archaeon]